MRMEANLIGPGQEILCYGTCEFLSKGKGKFWPAEKRAVESAQFLKYNQNDNTVEAKLETFVIAASKLYYDFQVAGINSQL
jgi:hypothetical protein